MEPRSSSRSGRNGAIVSDSANSRAVPIVSPRRSTRSPRMRSATVPLPILALPSILRILSSPAAAVRTKATPSVDAPSPPPSDISDESPVRTLAIWPRDRPPRRSTRRTITTPPFPSLSRRKSTIDDRTRSSSVASPRTSSIPSDPDGQCRRRSDETRRATCALPVPGGPASSRPRAGGRSRPPLCATVPPADFTESDSRRSRPHPSSPDARDRRAAFCEDRDAPTVDRRTSSVGIAAPSRAAGGRTGQPPRPTGSPPPPPPPSSPRPGSGPPSSGPFPPFNTRSQTEPDGSPPSRSARSARIPPRPCRSSDQACPAEAATE
mmetsp:Transcript_15991/g.35802  ORF Transcript_15991/g.35802 Transcript_15991/m.35802 type:complete len:322 (-) Transcript_15991:275-1240(-)